MKTKEQILEWLDEQPWANEFYKTAFLRRINLYNDDRFISRAFIWEGTEEGKDVWEKRDEEFREWYDSNDKPMSWEEYCDKNPIKDGECYINGVCNIVPLLPGGSRDASAGIHTMPKHLCEAFLAYMKLIQLRNAWVKGFDDNYHKIIRSDDYFDCCWMGETGLSFPTHEMVNEFIETFKDLLEIAKPLL